MSSNLGGVGSRVLAVHVKEGVAGAPLQPGQLHDVRAQPVRRLLVKNTERMLFYRGILQFFRMRFSPAVVQRRRHKAVEGKGGLQEQPLVA